MRNTIVFLLSAVLAAALLVPEPADAFGPGGAQAQKSGQARHRDFSNDEIQAMSKVTALIRTSLGKITIRFFPEKAPNHVNNFIELAKKGFYDGTAFHRVIPGFMVQGGDPNTRSANRASHGVGGPAYVMKAEFNDMPHKRGTISMARKGHPDSAGSQFFICVADSPWLDGQYTVFAEVVKGLDVVDKIVNQPRDRRDNPLERVGITVRINEPRPKKKKPEPEPEAAPKVINGTEGKPGSPKEAPGETQPQGEGKNEVEIKSTGD